MSVVSNNILAGASGQGGGYKIKRSLRFNSGDSAYLNRTPSAAGNRKTFTWSGWVKRSNITESAEKLIFGAGTSSGSNVDSLSITAADQIRVFSYGGSYVWQKITTAVFRDPSAWYHIVYSVDTTNATAEDRVKIYVNGVRLTTFGTNTNPTQNADAAHTNTTNAHYICKYLDAAIYANSYLADVHFIDGQALAPTDFGETDDNGVWQPKQFAGSYNFTPTITYPAVYISSAGVYGTVAGINSSSGVFSSTSSTGAGSIKVEFSPAISNVTQISFNGGGYSQNAAFGIKVNGIVTHSGLTTNSSYAVRTETISSTNISSFEIFSASDGWALGNLQFSTDGNTFTSPSGTPAVIETAGVNGFHLDFANNSSNAALGTDTSGNSNTWTVNNLSGPYDAATTLVNADLKSTPFTDSSSNNLTLTNVNSVTTASAGSNNFNINYASNFVNSSTQRIDVPSITVSAKYTIDYYYKTTSSTQPGNATIIDSNGEVFLRDYGTATSRTLRLYNGSYQDTAYTISQNTWYHVRISNSGIWVNGTSIQSSPLSIAGRSAGLTIGNYNSSSGYSPNALIGPIRFLNQDLGAPTAGGEPTTSGSLANSINVSTGASNDSLVDSPTNGTQTDTGAGGEVVGNYATWNPLDKHSAVTLANGNLDISQSSSGFGKASIHVSSGKWYWEQTRTDTVASVAGIALSSVAPSATYLGGVSGTAGFNFLSGAVYSSSPITKVNSSNVGAQANGSVAGFALDCDNGTLKLYINGVLQTANHITFTPGTLVTPAFGTNGTAVAAYPTNFGQRAFAYAAPSGYKCLNTANLPEPTIADGSKYFDTKLYTGTGSTQALTMANSELSPDFVWIKNRSSALNHHILDSVRGAQNVIVSNTTDAEFSSSGSLTSFNTNGFTVGSNLNVNGNGNNIAAWAWDAASSNTTIAAGSLNSSSYDQSQTWSNGKDGDRSDYPVTNVFDASLTTVGYGSVNQTITVTLPGGSIALTSLRVRADRAGTATGKFYVNGNDYTSQIASGTNWNTITGETSITSIGYASDTGSNFVGLYAVEVNGKQLVDSGVSVTNVPSIASTVRANPSAGFSIVKFTSADGTVGHGLSAAPHFIIAKRTDAAYTWSTFWHDLGNQKYIALNNSNPAYTYTNIWGSAMPTSSVFSFNTANVPSGGEVIAYCFAPVEGYSAIGSYTGNGADDGPFVYTGFKVAWLMVKNTTTSGETWTIYDAARDPHNLATNRLQPNASDAETSGTVARDKDFLSNGFKVRGNSGEQNTSGDNYVYLAFASNPFASNGGLAR